MTRTPKTFIITRLDQFIYLVGLAGAGLLNLVFDTNFFLSFKLFFLAAVALTIIRDWNYSWSTFTSPERNPVVSTPCDVAEDSEL